MPERTAIQELVQLGMEVTEGTTVPATVILQSMNIEFTPQVNTKNIRAAGYKFPSQTNLNKEWSTARVTGGPTFEEVIYPLSSLMKKVTPVPGGTTSKVWTFDPGTKTLETCQSFSVEKGQSVRAEGMPGAKFDSFGLNVTRDDTAVQGTMLAQAITDGITMAAGATELALHPILPHYWCIYLDPTYTAFGTTKLLRCVEFDWTYGAQWGPLWAINCAQSSYATTVQTEPKFTGSLVMEQDAAGMQQLTNLRQGTPIFIRAEAIGPQIDVGPPAHTYRITADFAWKVAGMTEGMRDGVQVVTWPLEINHDSGWGRAVKIVVENVAATL